MLAKFANLIRDLFRGEQLEGDDLKNAVEVVQSKTSGSEFEKAFKDLVKTFHIDARVFSLVKNMKNKGMPYDPINDLNAIKSWIFEVFYEILKKVNLDDHLGVIIKFINLRANEFAFNKLLEALGRDTGMRSFDWQKTIVNRSLSEFIKTYKRDPDLIKSEEDALLLGEILAKRVPLKVQKDRDLNFKEHDDVIKYVEEMTGLTVKSLSEPSKYLQSEGYEDPSFDTETGSGTKSKELDPEQTRRFITRKREVMKRILAHLKDMKDDKTRQIAYMTLFHPYFKELRDDVRDIQNKDLTNAWRTMLNNLMMLEIPKKVLDYNTEYTSRQQMADVLGLSERQVNFNTEKVKKILQEDPTLVNLLKEEVAASSSKDLKKYGKFLEQFTTKYSQIGNVNEKIIGDILETK